jgi:hypothetical protein
MVEEAERGHRGGTDPFGSKELTREIIRHTQRIHVMLDNAAVIRIVRAISRRTVDEGYLSLRCVVTMPRERLQRISPTAAGSIARDHVAHSGMSGAPRTTHRQ